MKKFVRGRVKKVKENLVKMLASVTKTSLGGRRTWVTEANIVLAVGEGSESAGSDKATAYTSTQMMRETGGFSCISLGVSL